ncbi:hypothetical protein X778_18825 [Pseudomonas aeruginosa VRFPA07]|nr:hypothetical protein X778_18825 [Pseudomonas aeruginosa VRFPA07]
MASSWHRFFLDAFVFFSYYNCYQKWFTLNCHAISSLHTAFAPQPAIFPPAIQKVFAFFTV